MSWAEAARQLPFLHPKYLGLLRDSSTFAWASPDFPLLMLPMTFRRFGFYRFHPVLFVASTMALLCGTSTRANEPVSSELLRSQESVPLNGNVLAMEAIRQLPPAPTQQPRAAASAADLSAIITSILPQGIIPGNMESPVGAVVPTVIPPIASSESLRDIVRRRKLALPLADAQIVVTKSQRRLDVMSGSTLVKSYRVALGENPTGHKRSQGDNRTPEGHFYICTRNSSTSQFHIFLGLSYPSLPDAARAVQGRQITPREYQLIRQRLASRGAPLWRTRLGGWIGIHGGTGARFAQKKVRERGKADWTAGCIALTDREIEEIHAATQIGTPVIVRP